MIKLVFGIIWLSIVSFFAFMFFIGTGTSLESFFSEPVFVFGFLIFLLFGLIVFISGLKSILKNNKTQRYGIDCYGIVRNLIHSGLYINDAPEYKAEIEFMNPQTNQKEMIGEIIGLNYYKYPVNSYVLCKYYNGDINIIRILPENEVPSSVKKSLPVINSDNNADIKYSHDKEYVSIDGIDYKKVQ